MKNFWKIWDCLAVGWLLVLSSIFVGNFLANYWGNGLPIARFNFDVMGEPMVESIILPIWLVMGLVTFIRMLRAK